MMRNRLTIVFLILLAVSGFGQFLEYNHPGLDWRTIETEHAYVHYHQGVTRSARLVAKIVGEIYEPVTSLYGYEPDTKLHFIVRDHEDNANGAAYYYDNKVEIWAPPADFTLRGDHDWLRNVVTHEFSHMISLGAARKFPRQIPAVYFQWIGYEDEKRRDVIHGYPNKLFSVPFAGTVMPMWFAEGMAQMQRTGFRFDTWDTHRDMLLRTAVLDGGLLPLAEMGVFGKNSIGNERVYNQGYALTLYIAYRYGEETVAALCRAMRAPHALGFNHAVRKVLGKPETALYAEWKDWITSGYTAGAESIREHEIAGRLVEDRGTGNLHAVWSPDGRRIAYLSDRDRFYMSQRSLFVTDSTLTKKRKIAGGVTSSASWSPDGGRLVYARQVRERNGRKYFDLFVADLKTGKQTRITKTRRARLPDWSPSGSRIAAVAEQDGTSNLVLVRPDGKGWKPITAFVQGEQIFSPRWMPDGRSIVFGISSASGRRDIARIDSSGGPVHYLLRTTHDTRDPFPAPDGRTLYYASDESGIFNIRKRDLETGEDIPVTRVAGGAFMPAVNASGRLVYSLFRSDGYKIARMDTIRAVDPVPYSSPYEVIREAAREASRPVSAYDDGAIPEYSSTPYKSVYSKLAFLPLIRMDYPGKIKAGSYFYGSDFLDKISLFGFAAINGRRDSDLYAALNYRRFTPTLFAELYHIRKNTSEEDYRYAYTLMAADLGADWKLGESNELRTAYQFSRYDATMTLVTPGQDIKIPYTYHIGNVFQLRLDHYGVPPARYSGIAPRRGRKIGLELTANRQRFIDGFEVHRDYGTLIVKKIPYNYFQFLVDWREYRPFVIPSTSLALRFRAGAIDRPVDGFYNFFAGGLDGLKGYPYYSIEGRKLIQAGAALRFPIWRKTGLRFAFFHIDNVFGSVYADVGNAWDDNTLSGLDWKTDVGAQLRFGLWAFYGFPMRFFVDAAYGFDKFEHEGVTYGREWRWYFGMLFDFPD